MVGMSGKLARIRALIERGHYFAINRPRQYGKTAMLFELLRRLGDEYLVLPLSIEGVGDLMFDSEESLAAGVVSQIVQTIDLINQVCLRPCRHSAKT